MGDWLPLTLGRSPISGGGQGREVPSTSLYLHVLGLSYLQPIYSSQHPWPHLFPFSR